MARNIDPLDGVDMEKIVSEAVRAGTLPEFFADSWRDVFGDAVDRDYLLKAGACVVEMMVKPNGKRQTPSKFAERLRAEARRFERLEEWRASEPEAAAWFSVELSRIADDIPAGDAGRKRGAVSVHMSLEHKWAKCEVGFAVEEFNKHVRSIGRDDLVGCLLVPGNSGAPGRRGESSPGRRLLLKMVKASARYHKRDGITDTHIKRAIIEYARTYDDAIGNVIPIGPRKRKARRSINRGL